jgi:hypothetical protein
MEGGELVAEDPYLPGREPGEPVQAYEARMIREAGELGTSVEDHKASLVSEQFRAEAPE